MHATIDTVVKSLKKSSGRQFYTKQATIQNACSAETSFIRKKATR